MEVNVKTMSYMFSDCSSLTSLNLSNCNPYNVEDMNPMYSKPNKKNEKIFQLSNYKKAK